MKHSLKLKTVAIAISLIAAGNVMAGDKEPKTWLDKHKNEVAIEKKLEIAKTPKGDKIELVIVRDKKNPYRKKQSALQVGDLIVVGDIRYILTKDDKAVLSPDKLEKAIGKVDATKLVNDFLEKNKGKLITFHKGNPDAKKKLLVIVEPNCPACRKSSQFLKKLADRGEVYVQYVVTDFLAPDSKYKAAWIDHQKDKAGSLYQNYAGNAPTIEEIKKQIPEKELKKSFEKAKIPIEYFTKNNLGYTPLIFEKDGNKWYLENPQ